MCRQREDGTNADKYTEDFCAVQLRASNLVRTINISVIGRFTSTEPPRWLPLSRNTLRRY